MPNFDFLIQTWPTLGPVLRLDRRSHSGRDYYCGALEDSERLAMVTRPDLEIEGANELLAGVILAPTRDCHITGFILFKSLSTEGTVDNSKARPTVDSYSAVLGVRHHE